MDDLCFCLVQNDILTGCLRWLLCQAARKLYAVFALYVILRWTAQFQGFRGCVHQHIHGQLHFNVATRQIWFYVSGSAPG